MLATCDASITTYFKVILTHWTHCCSLINYPITNPITYILKYMQKNETDQTCYYIFRHLKTYYREYKRL